MIYQFIATDENGTEYSLVAEYEAGTNTTFTGSTGRPGPKSIYSESGNVNRISRGVYDLSVLDQLLMDRKIRLTSDDPNAP